MCLKITNGFPVKYEKDEKIVIHLIVMTAV